MSSNLKTQCKYANKAGLQKLHICPLIYLVFDDLLVQRVFAIIALGCYTEQSAH